MQGEPKRVSWFGGQHSAGMVRDDGCGCDYESGRSATGAPETSRAGAKAGG